ncbi:MAG TPA: Crp/Fnr family transcriptional regulator [Candidatus Sulfotelmatobacter sp.]|nr:Crp/Fnr family transcriptional regulator [Candidatus Sulfotelmatobacter sp.]
MVTTTILSGPSIGPSFPQVEGNPIGNRILVNLPARECALVYPQLTFVEMKSHDVLQECEHAVKYAYFFESGVASVLNVTEDGRSVEVGILGKEGCTGSQLAVGLTTSVCRIVVHKSGTAFRIAGSRLVAALRQCPRLQSRIQQYTHLMAMQSAQFACCNQLHESDERLARWLLMSHDRLESDLIPVTQEFIAQMLGTRRASITVAAGLLQQAGLVRSARGSIRIVDRQGLEEASCECYQIINRRSEVWTREANLGLVPTWPAGRLTAGKT